MPRGCMFSKWPVVSVIAFIVLFGVPHAGAVQIAEPSTGAVVRPGTPVKVKVTIPPGLPVPASAWRAFSAWDYPR